MPAEATYDVIVLGAGPGGYACALRAAGHGLKVAIIERERIGGVCLNRGCIPTKVFTHAASLMRAPAQSSTMGVDIGPARLDMARLIRRKDEVVKWLTSGVEASLYRRQVDVFTGQGCLAEDGMVAVDGTDGHKVLRGSHRVVAAGSSERSIPGIPIDGTTVLGSTEMLQLQVLPRTLAIIGAGAVGSEFASAFADFGSEVTLIEALPRILPLEDEECAAVVRAALEHKGVRVLTSTPVRGCLLGDAGAAISCEMAGTIQPVLAERVLMAIGRRPNTVGIGLERLGVRTTRGFIDVDSDLRTSVPGVFAVGDCIPTLALADVAMAEGKYVADLVAGAKPPRLRYEAMPRATFTDPELASVGATEAEAKASHGNVSVSRFPLRNSGKAAIYGESAGMVKIVLDGDTGEIVGVHIAGHDAAELIAEAAMAMNLEATVRELAYTVHAHPTISEAVWEAAEAALGLSVHG